MKIINTDLAPQAIGPYSQAIASDGFVFCSGQIGLTPEGELVDGLEAQVKQIFKNGRAVLQEAGCELADVVKTTIYLKDIGDFGRVNEIYAEEFGDHKPARSTVGGMQLPKGALVEIEFLAKK